ncbi:variant surface glycoprotein (VSG), putative [Trypanosoma equiperdum]|uniref:Variant surface glycoprotein (VSG), putative n=1 Tax=Trypanosoma equiperdum TaxID=5694 RepID=A0A1G4I445_TRYEQ|nr:variant surface glycoprotein (VSG), putative [Trypanosoma equiperdum]
MDAAKLFVAAVLLAQTARAANEAALKPEAWKAVCDIYSVLSSKETTAQRATQTLQASLVEAYKKEVKARILLSKTADAAAKAKIAPLLAALSQHTAALMAEAAQGKLTAAATTIGATSIVMGRLKEYSAVAAYAKDGTTAGCWAADEAGNSFKTLAEAATQHTNCNEIAGEQAKHANLETAINSKGFTIAGLTVKACAVTNKGCRLHTRKTSEGIISTGSPEQTKEIAAGLIQLTAADPTFLDTKDMASVKSENKAKDIAAAWDAIQVKLQTYATEDWPQKAECTENSICHKVAEQAGLLSQPTPQKSLAEQLSETYGTEDEAVTAKLWKLMLAIPAPKAGDASTKNRKLHDVEDLDYLVEMLANSTAAQAKPQPQSTTQQTCTVTEAKDTQENQIHCKSISDKDKCNADPKCSYETESDSSKKCKLDAKKALATGVSVAQTQTGETTTEKCKGKSEKECKTSDCKWEGAT